MATEPIRTPIPSTDPQILQRPATERGQESATVRRDSESARTSAETPAPEAVGEKLQISRQARELLRMSELMSQAREKLEESPDVREEKIRAVRERLAAGVYETQAIRDELAHRLGSVLRDLPVGDSSDT